MSEKDKVQVFTDWLRASGYTVRRLADALGLRRATIYQWLAGHNLPSGDVLARLEALSGGAVTARSFTHLPPATARFKLSNPLKDSKDGAANGG